MTRQSMIAREAALAAGCVSAAATECVSLRTGRTDVSRGKTGTLQAEHLLRNEEPGQPRGRNLAEKWARIVVAKWSRDAKC